jgi:hypothetical protein
MNAPATAYGNILRTRRLRWWHESLADYILANPTATHAEIGKHFGRTDSTITIIVNTDAFKAYFRQRRTQYEEDLDAEVRGKLYKVASNSLDHMLDVLEKKRDSLPLEMLNRTAESALKNLGYGAPAPVGTTVNVNTPQTVNVAVSVEDLEAARSALRRNQQAKIIEHDKNETPPSTE